MTADPVPAVDVSPLVPPLPTSVYHGGLSHGSRPQRHHTPGPYLELVSTAGVFGIHHNGYEPPPPVFCCFSPPAVLVGGPDGKVAYVYYTRSSLPL